MKSAFLSALLLIGLNSHATDYAPKNNEAESARRGELVPQGATFAGYPLYLDGEGWKFLATVRGQATNSGNAQTLSMPSLFLGKYEKDGKLKFASSTTVTVGTNATAGWSGEPCKPNNSILIAIDNEKRGMSDRCAHVTITQEKFGLNTRMVVKGFAIESNSSGRYYAISIYYFIDTGSKSSEFFERDAEFKKNSENWVKSMKASVQKLSGYDKPLDIFSSASSFVEMFEPRANKVANEVKIEQNKAATIQWRLGNVDKMLTDGTISAAEHSKLRAKILEELTSATPPLISNNIHPTIEETAIGKFRRTGLSQIKYSSDKELCSDLKWTIEFMTKLVNNKSTGDNQNLNESVRLTKTAEVMKELDASGMAEAVYSECQSKHF